ncbi:hypothetical protein KIW84_053209 [Lathyrus oleraceus]|uniref:Uncharacterized protein n=1 Tax=Pisum sativum TaxID=3888 RepID=A0A9D5AGD6_PEA|nr:hypothetical protein KIW84_053209 [Pisum sativum]
MELSFSMLDVKEVIWCSGPDKSPDPNRFNLGFSKACWDIIKFDLFYYIMEFFQTTHLSKVWCDDLCLELVHGFKNVIWRHHDGKGQKHGLLANEVILELDSKENMGE